MTKPLSQFIRLERIGSHTQIQVDLDGKGVATTFSQAWSNRLHSGDRCLRQ
ncbi:hypothetical protein [Leptolyngbya ohadii]|uniref:hypothetical protein n=1 Tax=Leptolyngbya ohadii TaxID=1962290 RepID=UPI0015C60237|nr:hypothetical protein [Leptolyngbya ohadii]